MIVDLTRSLRVSAFALLCTGVACGTPPHANSAAPKHEPVKKHDGGVESQTGTGEPNAPPPKASAPPPKASAQSQPKFVLCDDPSEECRAVLVAEQAVSRGESSQAIDALEPWLKAQGQHALVVRLTYGQALLESASMAYGAGGDAAREALTLFEALLVESPLSDPLKQRITLQKSRALLALGRGEQALPLLRSLAEQFPAEAEVQAALGIAYLSVGQVSRSLNPLEKAAQLDPKNAERHLVLGTARMLVGEYAEAERSFRAALALDPHSSSAYGDLGALLLLQGNAKGGREYLKQAALLEPQRATFAANLAYAELLSERPWEAKKQAERAISLDPALASGWLNLGLAQVALGDRKQARISFEKAQSLDPTDPRPKNNLQDLDELEAQQP